MIRYGYVTLAIVAVGAVIIPAFIPPVPQLIWNASASAPIGLYRLHRPETLPVGTLVAVEPPKALARWMAERHYLPIGVPLLKQVSAVAGQRVCRHGNVVRVDGRVVGRAHLRDSNDCPLPVWKGCLTLHADQIFLMNTAVPDSLDGRYFGPLPVSSVIGRVTPLLTRDAPDRRLKWRGF